MKEKQIDLKKSVYELNKAYPEISDIMVSLGFKDIVRPGMLETAGRLMTIPKGAKLKGLDLEQIVKKLEEDGFEVLH